MARTYENWMFLPNKHKVLEFTIHAYERLMQREIDCEQVAWAVDQGVQRPDGKGNMRFTYGSIVVVIEKITANTYRVISVWEHDSLAA